MLVTSKSLQDWIDLQLQKWKTVEPNINISSDSMVYMDSAVIAELAYLLQYDMNTLINNAFLAYANGDELSNLGKDRGITRLDTTSAKGWATFGRAEKATENFTIPLGTLISTQPVGVEGKVVPYQTIAETILYGSISTPTAPVYTSQTTGGLIGNGTYRYKLTAITGDNVETDASPELSVTISNGLSTNIISLTWDSVVSASSYNLYIFTGTNFVFLHNTVNPAYIDTVGDSIQTQQPPATNLTGKLSVDIAIECTSGGAFGNTATNTIVEFINKPTGIERVTNNLATSGGTDSEDDDTYRARIAELLSSNTGKVTLTGYKQTCEAVPGVATATVTIPVGGAYRNDIEIVITSSTGSGIPDANLLATVLATVTLDENRAVCDNITVIGPVTQEIDYTISISAYDHGYTQSYIITSIQDNITAFFKSKPVGSIIYKVDIQNVIHDTLGVIDFSLVAPTTNTTLAPNAIAVTGTAVINFI